MAAYIIAGGRRAAWRTAAVLMAPLLREARGLVFVSLAIG
jgi:hypothetical protein